MKRIVVTFLAALLLFAGVVLGTDGGPRSAMVDHYGESNCFRGLSVVAEPEGGKISIRYREYNTSETRGARWLKSLWAFMTRKPQARGWTSESVQTSRGWRTGQGWFVFARDGKKKSVWIYNGESLQLVLITPGLGSATYGPDFPVEIPKAVTKRLASKQKRAGS